MSMVWRKMLSLDRVPERMLCPLSGNFFSIYSCKNVVFDRAVLEHWRRKISLKSGIIAVHGLLGDTCSQFPIATPVFKKLLSTNTLWRFDLSIEWAWRHCAPAVQWRPPSSGSCCVSCRGYWRRQLQLQHNAHSIRSNLALPGTSLFTINSQAPKMLMHFCSSSIAQCSNVVPVRRSWGYDCRPKLKAIKVKSGV